jgi:hypothetical protein
VQLLDPFGNLATGNTSSVIVALGANPGGGSLSGTATVAASGGVATFSTLSINKTGTGYTLTASDGSLTGATSGTFNITPGTPDHLAFGQQPLNGASGVPLSPAPTIQVLDHLGNLVTTDTSHVVVAIGTNPSGGTLSGTTNVPAVGGVATFSNLSIDNVGSGYTLIASDGSLTGVTSASFNITTPASLYHLAFGQQPTNTVAGATISPALTVRVLDQVGNLVTADTSNVTLVISANPGGGVLSGTTTVAAVGGIATFSGLSIDKAGTNYRLAALDGADGAATSSAFNITPAAADHLAFAVQPSNTVAGVAIAPAVTVQILDRFGNLETADNSDQVTVAVATGTGSFTGSSTLTATASSGVASFANLVLDTSGNYTLGATGTGSLTGPASASFTVSAATTDHLAVSAPATVTAGNASTIMVTALDRFGNITRTYTGTVHFTKSDSGAGSAVPANYPFVAGDNGVHTFTNGVTLVTSGSQTIIATDTGTSTITGSASIVVSAAAATHFTVSAPATTAGVAFAVTVTARDQFNNTATGYTGAVHFTSTDSQAALPANNTLTNGTGTFTATLKTAGNQTLTATDTNVGSLTGSTTVAVTAAAASHLMIGAPATATAGSAFNVTVTALDAFGNTAPSYTGTIHFTLSDSGSGAAAPADYPFVPGDAGVHTFNNGVTFVTAGSQTVTATDTSTSSITGTSGPVSVAAAAASRLMVGAPATVTAGIAFGVTVTALDPFGNTALSYTGTIHFSKSDSASGSAVPGNYTFVPGDDGVHTFSNGVTLVTGGPQTVTATDVNTSSITGTTPPIQVSTVVATHFVFSGTPASTTAGSPFTFTIRAEDTSGNTAVGYTGTIHFSSSDTLAALPSNAGLNNGVGTFTVTLKTAGSQTVTATDTANGSIAGSSPAVTVSAAAATHLAVTTGAPPIATAGVPFLVSVTAQDAFNNTAVGYSGTVHFSSSDAQANLPANSTLTNGVGTFIATLLTAGSQTITTTDTATGSITGTSLPKLVNAAAATEYTVSAPTGATAGLPFSITVTARDPFGNTATGYTGTVHFSSSDAQAVLPVDSTLTSGVATLGVTLKTAGNQTLTATDTVAGSITGASGVIAVDAAAASHYSVNAPASATAGNAFLVTVTALDPFNNTAVTYPGTVHLTSSDTQAVLPANATLAGGVGTFALTLKTAGSQTVTATDTNSSTITGSATVTVSPAAPHFLVSAPSTATAGTAFIVTVTAEDAFNNTAVAYSGTVHFSSSDAQAILPTDSTLTNGTGTFSVTLKKAGNQTLTTTDTTTSSITGSAPIAVHAGTATHFAVATGGAAIATAGSAFSATVTAEDAFNNTATSYAGTAHVGSSDPQAVLPANSALTNGIGTFSVTLKTAGSQTLTATDTSSSSITGSASVAVGAAPAAHFALTTPGTAAAGASFSITVTALDLFNNPATGYAGTVDFSSSDPQAGLPANTTLSNGAGTFTVTLKTAGPRTITATDTATSSIRATSGPITVAAGAANHLVVGAPASAVAGSTLAVTITAEDSFGNTAIAFADPIHFSSSDGQASLPTVGILSNGTGTFAVTLGTAGNQTVTATDAITSTITGTSNAVAVSAGAATHYDLSAPGTAVAGEAFSVTVAALDQFGNLASGYTGTVHFTSTGQATLPADTTLTNSAGTFSVTLATAGPQTITATDIASSAITGSSTPIAVAALAATHFVVSTPSGALAGTGFLVTVTAADPFGNTDTSYTGQVHFRSSDAQAALPADAVLTAGMGTFSVTLRTAGNQTVTATDTATSTITGTSGVIDVAAAGTHFVVSAPATTTAGTTLTVTVTAEDPFGNAATGYEGTVKVTSSDGQASLPVNATVTNGVGTFSITLRTAGIETLTVTDTATGAITGTSGPIAVTAAAANHLSVSASPNAIAGAGLVVIVTALDSFGNTATGYTGTVHFRSSDAQAALPAVSTLRSGQGVFSVTLGTAGPQTLTVNDTANSSITGTSAPIRVTAGTATHFVVSAAGNATAGAGLVVLVTAEDPFGNTSTSYGGIVHFSSSDAQAMLPPDSALTNGTGTFAATLDTAGTQTITATDVAHSAITGTSAAISVSAEAATHFAVKVPATATAGSTFTFTVMAEDPFDNLAPNYSDTVHFTSSDIQATLPADTTLTAGVGTFSGTLRTAGSQVVAATDAARGSIAGTSAGIAVAGAAATHFSMSTPATVIAGVVFDVTVTARDAFNNPATGYTGMVRFTSSDAQADLLTSSTLNNGVGTFSVQLKTAGSQTLTATDTTTSALTGTSAPIPVGAAPASHFQVAAPGNATAGGSLTFTVTALDPFNNQAPGYAGLVRFTSSDARAMLPAPGTLTGGTRTFTATLETAGAQTLTATDVTSSIAGTSAPIAVAAGAADHFVVSTANSATAGTAVTVTVTAEDAFGNTATGYTGTIDFTSSDPQAALPPDGTLTMGTGTFAIALDTAGAQTITATDTVSGATGSSAQVTVRPTAATHFQVSVPTSAAPGTAFSFTIAAQDPFGNTAPDYAGTIHFTTSDSQAELPADTTLFRGVGTFTATLNTPGNQTIAGTDTVHSSITGTSPLIAVGSAAATATTITQATPAMPSFGKSVTFTAVVRPILATVEPAGTVNFLENGTLLSTRPLQDVGGVATATFTSSATQFDAGAVDITAVYMPATNSTYTTSTSSPFRFLMSPSATITVLTSTNTEAVFGQATIEAMVNAANSGAGAPTGTVTFTLDNGTTLTSVPAPLVAGTATLPVSPDVGHSTITATYDGAGNFAASPPSTLTQIVNPAATRTTVAFAPATPTPDQFVTLTATVSAIPPGAGVPSGTVTFTIDGTPATAPLAGSGQATVVVQLTTGTHAINAFYNGSVDFQASAASSGPNTLTVSPASSGPPPAGGGARSSISATVVRFRHRPQVKVFNGDGSLRFTFFPYARGFHGTARVAVANVPGGGTPAVVVAPGAGVPEPVRVFDGSGGSLLRSIRVTPQGSRGGLFVAAGDINGDGKTEVLVGVGPEVRGYDSTTGQLLFRLSPFGRHGKHPVRVAVLDLNNDGVDEILAVRGSQVAGFDGRTLAPLSAAVLAPFLGKIIALAST